MLNSIIISMPYTKNNSRYSKNPPYNGFYSVLQHNNNYVAKRTKEEKYMVKRRLKSVIAAVLVAAMLTTMAPQVVCKAAETAWEIVKNQETPLDEVYFDCKKSDDETKSYLYGYKDGKVAIMDSDYKLVKKTDYDEIAAMKEKVKGETAYIVSKKVGEEKYYGIMSETGQTILEPKYLYMWSGDNAIQIREKVNGEQLVGLLSYDDLKQIMPCEYNYIDCIIKKDENLFIGAYYNGNYTVILNGKSIFSMEQEEGYYVNFEFGEYENQKSILVFCINENNDRISKVNYILYDGTLIKEMTGAEYEKEQNGNDNQDTNKDDRDKWLNEACESDKLHVEEFYKSKNITPSNLKAKIYDGHQYYWIIVTGKYEDTDGEETENKAIIYSFIYDRKGNCLLSGRSFFDRSQMMSGQSDREGRTLLDDTGLMCYLNDDNNEIEKLFKVKDDRLPYMCGDSEFNNEHYLIYNYGNIIETGKEKDYKRIYVYKDKKVYSYDYKYSDYYFVETESGLKMYHCGLDRKQKRELDNEQKRDYDGNVLWKDYGKIDIELDTLVYSSKDEVDTGLLVDNGSSRKIYYIGEDKQYTYTYEKLGVPEIKTDEDGNELNGDIYIRHITDCSDDYTNWIYFSLKINNNTENYCISTETGNISKVLFDINNKDEIENRYDYMIDLGDKLYLCLWTNTNIKILEIDKKSFETETYTLAFDRNDQEIVNLFMLNNKVYIQYKNEESYYGVLDLSGKIYIDASKKEYKYKFFTCGDYLYQHYTSWQTSRLYDSSLNSVSEGANVDNVCDYEIIDKNVGRKKIDGVYEISCYNTRELSNEVSKLVIADENIDKIIYEIDDNVTLRYFTQIDNYYVMSIYNYDNKTTERVIIDSTTGEQLYSGDGYIYVDDFNKKFVVINKRKNTPTSVPTGSAITVPTPTPTSEPIESTMPAPIIKPTESLVPAPTINPTETPVSTVRPTETPVPIETVKPTENPVTTIAPTESPTAKPVNTPVPTKEPTASPVTISVAKKSIKVKTGKSTKISYSAYNTKGKRVKVKAVSSNTKAAKVSVLSTSQLEITVPDNAKDGAVSKITLTNGKKKTTIKVTVQAVKNKVSKLKAKTKKVNVKKGKKSSLTYNYTAQDNKKSLTENVKISSSKKSIVKIVNKKLSNGKVTVGIKAVKKGTANITVKIGDKTATTKVVVK